MYVASRASLDRHAKTRADMQGRQGGLTFYYTTTVQALGFRGSPLLRALNPKPLTLEP